jgi:hypothetical protein
VSREIGFDEFQSGHAESDLSVTRMS